MARSNRASTATTRRTPGRDGYFAGDPPRFGQVELLRRSATRTAADRVDPPNVTMTLMSSRPGWVHRVVEEHAKREVWLSSDDISRRASASRGRAAERARRAAADEGRGRWYWLDEHDLHRRRSAEGDRHARAAASATAGPSPRQDDGARRSGRQARRRFHQPALLDASSDAPAAPVLDGPTRTSRARREFAPHGHATLSFLGEDADRSDRPAGRYSDRRNARDYMSDEPLERARRAPRDRPAAEACRRARSSAWPACSLVRNAAQRALYSSVNESLPLWRCSSRDRRRAPSCHGCCGAAGARGAASTTPG